MTVSPFACDTPFYVRAVTRPAPEPNLIAKLSHCCYSCFKDLEPLNQYPAPVPIPGTRRKNRTKMIRNTTAQRVYPPNTPISDTSKFSFRNFATLYLSRWLPRHVCRSLNLISCSCARNTCRRGSRVRNQQNEQNEDDEKHNCPARVVAKNSVVHFGSLLFCWRTVLSHDFRRENV